MGRPRRPVRGASREETGHGSEKPVLPILWDAKSRPWTPVKTEGWTYPRPGDWGQPSLPRRVLEKQKQPIQTKAVEAWEGVGGQELSSLLLVPTQVNWVGSWGRAYVKGTLLVRFRFFLCKFGDAAYPT